MVVSLAADPASRKSRLLAQISPSERDTLRAVEALAARDQHGTTFAGIERIARERERFAPGRGSAPRSVRRHLAALAARGLLARFREVRRTRRGPRQRVWTVALDDELRGRSELARRMLAGRPDLGDALPGPRLGGIPGAPRRRVEVLRLIPSAPLPSRVLVANLTALVGASTDGRSRHRGSGQAASQRAQGRAGRGAGALDRADRSPISAALPRSGGRPRRASRPAVDWSRVRDADLALRNELGLRIRPAMRPLLRALLARFRRGQDGGEWLLALSWAARRRGVGNPLGWTLRALLRLARPSPPTWRALLQDDEIRGFEAWRSGAASTVPAVQEPRVPAPASLGDGLAVFLAGIPGGGLAVPGR